MNLPFFAVAGDLTALAPVVFHERSARSGPRRELGDPDRLPCRSRHDDRMLVDGWVCDPLPGRRRPGRRLRARDRDRPLAARPSDRPPRRCAPAAVAPPGLGGRLRILAIAMRAMELASQEHVARSLPLIDVLVRPDLDGFSSADFDGAAEMCARGEQAAEEAIPAIREGREPRKRLSDARRARRKCVISGDEGSSRWLDLWFPGFAIRRRGFRLRIRRQWCRVAWEGMA